MTSGEQHDQPYDPDADPDMLTSNASQPDQAEGEDDPAETGSETDSDGRDAD
ncbi:hypothetical protein [Gordonia sp. NPDC127522]|uniref:hypothetical protein n=1 Tax=Gordonia sp. NPDC127522 TaxID=3345390 RepID=UPI0036451719